jgi:ESCRT-II complex subunit VPS25
MPRLGNLTGQHLGALLEALVGAQEAAYEPPKQTSTVLLYWRKPEEWAETLHKWVRSLLQVCHSDD